MGQREPDYVGQRLQPDYLFTPMLISMISPGMHPYGTPNDCPFSPVDGQADRASEYQ